MNGKWPRALGIIGIGWFIVFAILVGVLSGRWLDEQLGSEPVFLLIGLILGLAIAFYGTFLLVPRINNNQSKGNS
jgi:F0F1-type ATP synthase assembly protein I